MKTWEMIKELTENPEKEFVQKNNKKFHVFMTVDGEVFYGIDGDGQTKPLVLDNWLKQEWEEVKEPVDFKEAINSGKCIKPATWDTDYWDLSLLMHALSDYDDEDIREIINGEWYIED